MKSWWPVMGVIFAATLAYVIGVRLSESAMAVVIGVIFGVAASVPTSVLLVVALRRSPREVERPREASQPPVVVVAPPTPAQWPGRWRGPQEMYLPPLEQGLQQQMPPRRHFRVVGED